MFKRQIAGLMLVATVVMQVGSPVAAAVTVTTVEKDLSTQSEVAASKSEDAITDILSIVGFDLYKNSYLEAYDQVFKVSPEKIASIKNNGGQYASSSIDKAIDGDFTTHWETGKPNSSSFTNEVTITFEELETISRLVYGARQDSAKGKGCIRELELYVSETETGDDFTLLGTGSYQGSTGDILEVRFAPTEMKRIKFVFKEANQDWASACEFQFYKEDSTKDRISDLFTNNAYVELKEEYKDIAVLNELKESVLTHPLKEELTQTIDLAISIVTNQVDFEGRVIVAEQYGDRSKHANQNLLFGLGNNNQPTGISAMPGETFVVYVDAEEGAPLPTLVFSQQEGSFANWARSVQLKVGKNVITVPTVPKDNWYQHEVTKGGPVYIVNPYTPEEQGSAPIIRFEGGERFPILTADTNEEEFLAFLTEYKARIDQDATENPDVLDRKVIDTFELVTEHLVLTATTTAAYEAFVNRKIQPLETVASYENYMDVIFEFYGLDGSNIKNDPLHTRENVRLAQPFGAMYAAGNHTGVQRGQLVDLLTPFEDRSGCWGITHELGHRMDMNVRLYGESTNNMLAQYMSVYYGYTDLRIPYESHIYKNVVAEQAPYYPNQGFFERIGVFWQLEMYYEGYWGELNRYYRERNPQLDSSNSENSKMQYLVEYSSEILGLDLSEHFARHGFEVNEDTKEKVSVYPKPDEKIWYLNTYAIGYEGDGFNADTELEINKVAKPEENTLKLTFTVPEEMNDDVLGFEVFKNGTLVAFSSNNYYTDKEAFTADDEYSVVAYAKDLSTSNVKTVKTQEPNVFVTEKITLELNQEFQPLEYVKAYDYLGNQLDTVEVSHTVDTTKNGTYEVIYTVTENGYTIQKTAEVEVVSTFDYLSDYAFVSSYTQWGSIRKNTNLKLNINNQVTSFEKGFGIHANGNMVFDLSGKEYDIFEAFVGVDQGLTANDNSSVIFKFYADGKEVYNSGVMKYYDEAKLVRFAIRDVEELKIVIDNAGNGNTSDHGVIGNAILTSNDAKPTIQVTDQQYRQGEEVDFLANVTASDKEDGDLTKQVEIISNTFKENKLGRFEVVYRVTDSDGNRAEATAFITVYEEISVEKSSYGSFDKLAEYNALYRYTVSKITNNGSHYNSSAPSYAIDGDINTHWETGTPNSSKFTNEVIFDLGETKEIDKIAYAARRGGKGFATKFEIYVSTEAEGNDFILAGTGSYNGNRNDVITIDITNREARRVKFKFIEAYDSWASIGEMSFYKTDETANKLLNELFTDSTKTEVAAEYNTLEKLAALQESVKDYPAVSLFTSYFTKAEELIRAKFPTLTIPKSSSTKVGVPVEIAGDYSAVDQEDGNITSNVVVSGKVDFDQPGEYKVTYTITDRDGNTVTASRTIAVVDMNDFTYLTKYNWSSTTNSYTRPVIDQSTSGRAIRLTGQDGKEVVYEKGIGAHSTSTIIYDLTDKNYDYFTAFAGVDRQMYGTVGSVEFKVYVDGELQFTSGVMTSKQEQKQVEVDINGAKELKLVVTDGGNGNGSDHANWADTKLHFANSATKGIDRSQLDALMVKVEAVQEAAYTTESYAQLMEVLQKVETELNNGYTQEEVDTLYEMLQQALDALVIEVDLTEVVKFTDTRLKKAVKAALGITKNNVTIGDLYALTELDASASAISSLEGLQYAKNLKVLKLDYNEISDFSVLKDLKQLAEFSATEQYVVSGYANVIEEGIMITEEIINQDGNRLTPTKVTVADQSERKEFTSDFLNETGDIVISNDHVKEGICSILVEYADEKEAISIFTIYIKQ